MDINNPSLVLDATLVQQYISGSEKAIEKLHGTKVLKEKIRVKRSNQN